MIQPDGYMRIVDRKKDMILVSGFNVYPNELEDVLATLPGVLQCAAIGVPDEKSGEAIKSFMVANRADPDQGTGDGAHARQRHRLIKCRVQRGVPRRAADHQRRQDPAP